MRKKKEKPEGPGRRNKEGDGEGKRLFGYVRKRLNFRLPYSRIKIQTETMSSKTLRFSGSIKAFFGRETQKQEETFTDEGTKMKKGFDNDKYVQMQSEHIRERIASFGDKLYLEFGGKLYDDYHASRVLPGFAPDSKLNMLMQLKDQAEIVIVINAGDIEKNKVREDLDITYDRDVLRLKQLFTERGLYVGSVVVTQYTGQKAADLFRERLKAAGIPVYTHYVIENYPNDVPLVISEDGFGKNDYIETSRPLVVVTAPGPGSGKMATCLSQLYHENRRGIRAGYAKFETFPI